MCYYSYNFNQWQFTTGVGPLLIKHLPQRMADTGVCILRHDISTVDISYK